MEMAKKYSGIEKTATENLVLSYDPINILMGHYFWDNKSRGVNKRAFEDLDAIEGLYPNAKFTFVGANFEEGIFEGHKKIIIPLDKSESSHSLRGMLEEAAEEADYIIIHNALRGTNPFATKAFKEFTEISKKPTHYVIHDGIWDHPEDWNQFNKVFEHTRQAFPSTENFTCSVLTPPAKPRAQNHYNGEVYVIRNSINCSNFSKDPKKDPEFRKLLEDNGIIDSDEVIIPSANRIVDRKALEIGFVNIQDYMNQTGKKAKFVVTESIDSEKVYPSLNVYQRTLELLGDKHKIPYSFGEVSKFLDDKNFNSGNLYRLANEENDDTFIPFPSEIEGFGFANLEAPLCDTPLVGRYLTNVHPDFERRGMNFKHFFDEELVRTFPIEKWVERMKYADNILSDAKALKKFSKEFNLMGRIEASKRVNEDNKIAIQNNYNHLTSIYKLVEVMKMPGYEKLENKVA